MREALITILAVLAIATPAQCNDKDGFNLYKDFLRARSDEGIPEGPVNTERMLYFYRTPLELYPGLLPIIEKEYRKRTGNVFKNHMLNKEMWADGPPPPGKRSSKTALAFLMEGKHPYHTDNQGDDLGSVD